MAGSGSAKKHGTVASHANTNGNKNETVTKRNMKIVLMPIIDTPCVCGNCKKEFIIQKEKMLEDYRQCTWCGSLKWKYKEDIKIKH